MTGCRAAKRLLASWRFVTLLLAAHRPGRAPAVLPLDLAGALCLALAFGLWIALVAPVNAEWSRALEADSASVVSAYLQHRVRWAYTRAAGFSAAIAGFGLLVALAPRAPVPSVLPGPVRRIDP